MVGSKVELKCLQGALEGGLSHLRDIDQDVEDNY